MDLLQAIRKYKYRIDEGILASYEDYDKFIYINENDEDLQKWRIRQPEPPEWHKIDGFGKHAMQQVFQREQYPVRLKALEESVVRKVNSKRGKRDSDMAVEREIYDKTFEELERQKKDYKDEINWIKLQWWHFNYGKWIMVRGKPIHINNWHWFYLNYFEMEDLGLPEFRIRDYKWFKAQEYAATTTETVIYKDGKLELLNDGTPKMKDIGVRTIFGTNNLKGRRVGETSKTQCINYCVAIGKMDSNNGLQANSENTAEDIYTDKLLYGFDRMPFFFKPIMKNQYTKSGLNFNSQFGSRGLNSKIGFATTAKKEFYDQKRLDFYHGDEIAKTLLENVVDRHGVVKRCCSEGDVIKGFMIYTSTSEDMDADNGIRFEKLSLESMFEKRLFNGQTQSGLINVYFPMYESYKGFIDRFGYGITDTPKEYQVQDMSRIEKDEYGNILGAKGYIEKIEKDLLESGDLTALAQFQRQHPNSFRKCFALATMGTKFNTQILQETITELKFNYKPRIGKFIWTGAKFNSPVEFVDDPNGNWQVSMVLPKQQANQTIFNGETKLPRFDSGFIVSSDSYRYDETDGARKSMGAISVYQMYDASIDGGKDKAQDWLTERFVADYLGREATRNDFADEALKASVYYNALLYPEANLSIEQPYFIDNGYYGYLLFDVDPETGKKKSNSGFNSAGTGNIKQKLFSHVDTWINLHGRKCKHQRILEDYLGIRDPKYMKDFDLFVASAGCLLGSQSKHTEYIRRFSSSDMVDVSGFWGRR